MIDIGKVFYHRLVNRDQNQGDGKYNAVEFRENYLKSLDNRDVWGAEAVAIDLDFANVKKIGPSFANEAFAYFTKYAKPAQILNKIKLHNISVVQQMIIEEEIESGYTER